MKSSLIFTIAVVFTVGITPAFAAQPYVGGASNYAKEPANAIFFDTEFNGVHDASQWTISLQSVAMSNSTASTAYENGWVYQQGAVVETDEKVWVFAEIWDDGPGHEWYCDELPSGCPKINDDVDNLTHIYMTLSDAGSDDWTFTYTAYKSAGGFTFIDFDYSEVGGDDSEAMIIGYHDYGFPEVKYYQVGIESNNEASSVEINQFGIGWSEIVGGTKLAKDHDWYVVEAPDDTATWDSTISCPDGSDCRGIGLEDYTDVNADYDLKSGSSMPDGEVQWFYDASNDISEGTQLWT